MFDFNVNTQSELFSQFDDENIQGIAKRFLDEVHKDERKKSRELIILEMLQKNYLPSLVIIKGESNWTISNQTTILLEEWANFVVDYAANINGTGGYLDSGGDEWASTGLMSPFNFGKGRRHATDADAWRHSLENVVSKLRAFYTALDRKLYIGPGSEGFEITHQLYIDGYGNMNVTRDIYPKDDEQGHFYESLVRRMLLISAKGWQVPNSWGRFFDYVAVGPEHIKGWASLLNVLHDEQEPTNVFQGAEILDNMRQREKRMTEEFLDMNV